MKGSYSDGADFGNTVYATEEAPKFNPTKQMVHASVEKTHDTLTDKQRGKIVIRLRDALDSYEFTAIRSHWVRNFIYRIYNEKIMDDTAVSTMSRDFNMSIHGHNKELAAKVKYQLNRACHSDNHGYHSDAISILLGTKIQYTILLDPQVIKTLELEGHKLGDVDEINYCRERLFDSVIKMVSDLAIKRGRYLTGDVIEPVDLIQEALTLTKDAISKYRPHYTDAKDAGSTFTSFIYRTVYNNLSHFVVDSSRNVRVPRKTIDRARPIYYALDKLGNVDYQILADEATRILATIRLRNARRKLIQNERYTAEEVHDLLMHTQEEASMDAIISTDEAGHVNTFGELLVSDTPKADSIVDRVSSQAKLIEILKDYCNGEEEATIMALRWGGEKCLGLKATSDLYKNVTKNPMNKTKVAQVESDVFGRLRAAIGRGDEKRVDEVREALHDLSD